MTRSKSDPILHDECDCAGRRGEKSAFDLTHEIAAAESKDIPDNRITSGGQ
jgi:hypothetical protein